jgi:hypothetical protein
MPNNLLENKMNVRLRFFWDCIVLKVFQWASVSVTSGNDDDDDDDDDWGGGCSSYIPVALSSMMVIGGVGLSP